MDIVFEIWAVTLFIAAHLITLAVLIINASIERRRERAGRSRARRSKAASVADSHMTLHHAGRA